MKKPAKISLGIFPAYLFFFPPGWSEKKLRGFLKKECPKFEKHADLNMEDLQGFFHGINNHHALIWVDKKKSMDGRFSSTLLHEVVHAVDFFSKSFGFSSSPSHEEQDNGSETRAYLTEYLFNECLDAIKTH